MSLVGIYSEKATVLSMSHLLDGNDFANAAVLRACSRDRGVLSELGSF